MDLTNLRDSLDSSSRERHPARASAKKSEIRLTRDFKAAALQLTTLYRSALSSSNRSYATGYAQSLSDILDVVSLRLQQPASTAPGFRSNMSSSSNSNVETDREELRWLVRYLRARIEAIRVESEEEEREESEEEDVAEGQEGLRQVQGSQSSQNAQLQRDQRSTKGGSKNATSTRETSMNSVQIERNNDQMCDSTADRVETPSNPNFTFSVPSTSSSTSLNGNRNRRGREQDESPPQTELQAIETFSSHPSSVISPSTIMRASSDDDEEGLRQRTSSRRQSSRFGKRMGGREKLSGLELFARAQNVKRRRGLGDSRDDDDGLL